MTRFFSTLPALIISLTENGGLFEYEDIGPLSIGASNGGTGAAIGKGTVRVPLLLNQADTPGLDTIIQGLTRPNKKMTSIPLPVQRYNRAAERFKTYG